MSCSVRILLMICVTLLVSYGQQMKQVIFGEGIMMDLTTGTPVFSQVPSWQQRTIMPYRQWSNQVSVWPDEDGKIKFYFLNGKYFDAQHQFLADACSKYFDLIYSFLPSNFLKFPDDPDSVMYHFFCYVDTISPFNIFFSGFQNNFSKLNCRLNKLVFSQNSFYVDSVFEINLHSGNTIISHIIGANHTIRSRIGTYNVPIHLKADNSFQLLYAPLSINFFSSNVFNTLAFKITKNNVFFDTIPLITMSIYPYFYDVIRDLLITFNNATSPPNFCFCLKIIDFKTGQHQTIDTKFNLLVPNLTSLLMFPSNLGRYLYFVTLNTANDLRIFRYDLYKIKDPLVFTNNVQEVPLSANLKTALRNIFFVTQSGSFLNNISLYSYNVDQLYFIRNQYASFNLPNYVNSSPSNNRVNRILNSDADDINQVTFEFDIYQGPPHSTFGTFPSPLPLNSLPPAFIVKNACTDSTHFHLNYTAIADSVWWDFGDPAGLGPLNHSSQFHPVVKYPQHGTYYVQVQLWYDGDSITTMGDSVKVLPVPQVDLGFSDTLLCRGESVLLDASQGFPATYLWSTGSTDSTLSVSKSGRYWVQVSTPCGTVSDTVSVSVIDPPTVKVHDTAVCFFGPVLYDVSADSATYLWSDGSTSPTFAPRQMGTYWVEVSNPCGGYRQDFRVELQNCETTLYIPNAFTPNGDGRNDCFEVVGDNLSSYQIQVFSRWGELVYQSDDISQCWDGTHRGRPVPDGVYLYVIRHTDRHGNPMPIRRGEIRLYR